MVTLRTIGVVGLLAFGAASVVHADTISLRQLKGTWTGGGKVTLVNGSTERLKCNGYYTGKGSDLGIAITCGNAGFKINMRAKLNSSGSSVTGKWEERQFNQEGDITGKITDSGLNMVFSGAISGKMIVKLNDGKQNVTITTAGPGFTGVNLSLRRSS